MRAWYINLASRPDRRDAIDAQLTRLGITGERVDAVLFDDLPESLRQLQAKVGQGSRFGRREFCNAVSHRDALQRFLATGDRYGMVLEDDIVLSMALPAFLAVLEARSDTVDLLRLETFGNPQQISTSPIETIAGYGFHTLHGWAWGAAAYVVSREAARKLCDSKTLLGDVIDRVLYRPNAMRVGPLRRRQLIPALAIQDDRLPGRVWGGDSDLKATRDAQSQQIRQRPLRAIAGFVENEVAIGLPSTIHRLLGRSTKRDVPFRPE